MAGRSAAAFPEVVSRDYFDRSQDVENAQNSIQVFRKKYGVSDGEWGIALKLGWRVLCRPGVEWPIRLYAGLQLHTVQFRRELAVRQVRPGLLVPLGPMDLARAIQRYALMELERSKVSPRQLLTTEQIELLADSLGRKPSDAELIEAGENTQLLTSQNLRKYLERGEDEDGILTRVRAEGSKMDLPDSLAEAIKSRIATPLASITDELQLKKLNGKCFLYGHVHPRPATLKVFLRQAWNADDDGGQIVAKPKGKSKQKSHEAQGSFDFMQDTEFSSAFTKATERAPEKAAQVMSEIEREIEDVRRKATARLLAIAEEPEHASVLNSNGHHSQQMSAPRASVEGKGDSAARAENTSAPTNSNGEGRIAANDSFPSVRVGAETPLVSGPRGKISEAEAYQVLDALEKYCNATLEDAAMLISRCRQYQPVTVAQIVQAIELKGKAAKHKDSPIAYIMFWTPRLFQSTPERKSVESHSEPNMALIRSLYEKGTAEDRRTLLAEYPELAPVTAAHGD